MSISLQLEKIKDVAEKKAEELDKIEYEKYHPYMKLAVRFLKKEKALLYGGSALNDIMPSHLKFYSAYSLPDIDVFAIDAKAVANRVVKQFREKGYKLSSWKEALHPNTYKVFVDGLQILDISDVPQHLFAKLAHGGPKSSFGIKIVNPDFLRMSLHLMLSHPYDAHRWAKVYERLVLFYKVYPPRRCSKTTKQGFKDRPIKGLDQDILDRFKGFVKDHNYVMFGGTQVQEMLFKSDYESFGWPYSTYYDIIVSDDVKVVADKIKHALGNENIVTSEVFKGDDIVPEHILIMYEDMPLFGVYQTSYCVSFVEMNGLRMASFHTLCQMYMSFLFSPYKHHSKEHIRCIVNMLGVIQLRIMKNPSRKKMYNQFVMECYGTQSGLVTMKRQQIERIVYAKNK
jgi:hypothetical protein